MAHPNDISGSGFGDWSPKGGSRMDGPLVEGPQECTCDAGDRPHLGSCPARPAYGAYRGDDDPVREARELLGWMKANDLVTQDRAGYVRLRSKGRAVLIALDTFDKNEAR